VGPGALGCLFGGLLALAGHDVRMLARRAEHAERLARDGLRIERDGAEQRATVRADTDPARLGPVDLAIVLVKATDTAAAATSLPALLGPDGVAVSLQNGLGNVDALASVLGVGRVLGGVTSQGATLLGPGHVRHAGFGPTSLAEAGDSPAPRVDDVETPGIRTAPSREPSARAIAIAALLDAAGLPARAAPAVEPLVWGKLIANAAINALGTLLRCPNGALVERPSSAPLFDGLAAEAGAVAAALGVALPFPDAIEHARGVARVTAANRNSMLQDIEAGRRTEIDAINGGVACLGAEVGMPTPLNATVAALIRAIEEGTGLR